MKKGHFLTPFLLVASSYNCIALEPQKELTLNSIVSMPFHSSNKEGCMDRFYEKLFAEIGIKINFVEFPAKRALQLANQGTIDGDVSRFSGVGKNYDNLIRVPFPIYRTKLVLVSNREIEDSVDSILQKEKIGVVLSSGLVRRWVPEKNQIITKDFKQLLSLLKSGRINYSFLPIDVLFSLEINNDSKFYVRFYEENDGLDVFLFLHKKHKKIIPKLLNILNRPEYSTGGLSNACKEFREIVKLKYSD